MEYLVDFFNKLIVNIDNAQLFFMVLVGLTVGFITFLIAQIVSLNSDPVRRRVDDLADVNVDDRSERFDTLMDSASPYVLPAKGKDLSSARERLIHAGYRSRQAATIFFVIKLTLGLVFPILVIIGARFNPIYPTLNVIIVAIAASFLGMLLPNMVLDKLFHNRQDILRKGFPDVLDLLVICVESGLGLNAAIQRVSKELAVSHPILADELGIVNDEIRAGVPRNQALHNLASRTGLPDIKGLVSTLSQSIRLGTSVSDTLRIYSEEFRDKQMQRAEEKAAMIGTKLIFPLVFCIFPAFFVIAVGPAVIAIIKALGEVSK